MKTISALFSTLLFVAVWDLFTRTSQQADAIAAKSMSPAVSGNQRRTEPVEKKRERLLEGGLCPSYSTDNDKYKWTTDEGRCVYEYWKKHYAPSSPSGFQGTVLEMGVVQGSSKLGEAHSHAIQYELGWDTILVEANPEMEPFIRENRPGATLHMTPICSKPTTLHFRITDMVGLNGFAEFHDEEVFQTKLKSRNGKIVKTIPMQCQPMAPLLKDVPVIDTYFLDVEGAELMVLESIDFSDTCIQIFNIEDGDPSSSGVGTFLTKKGFKHVGWNTEQYNHVWVNSKTCRPSHSAYPFTWMVSFGFLAGLVVYAGYLAKTHPGK
ncbi:expressed unknown protein [Seminavis robusta]|uniref:Methyltransferase FkbM domain-containing protein n=1 Tax=Seminavis robusta TaxID=568900 RepID=A0A9N8HJ52_9STRA|nr:expressed unknown protein [Seminavis robusta]|eukprot:Sro669_g184450.1 n/a (323) ;mRNA; r:2251-3219